MAAPRAREGLRAAVDALADIDRQIAQAASATQAAMDGRRTARRTLQRVNSEPDLDVDAQSFIDAVSAGDAPVSLAPSPSKADVVRPLQAEAERWDQMLAACEARAKELTAQRERATWKRDAARDAVVAQSDVAQALLADLGALQEAVLGRRILLSKIAMNRMASDDVAAQIRAVLNALPGPLPTPTNFASEWNSHGAAVRWRQGIDALVLDPDAPMPSLGELLGEGP